MRKRYSIAEPIEMTIPPLTTAVIPGTCSVIRHTGPGPKSFKFTTTDRNICLIDIPADSGTRWVISLQTR
jgi:hypothetical protein